MIFCPGQRLDLVAKGIRSGADAVIVDLEDAVAADAKADARRNLAELPAADVPLYVRVNGAETGHLWADTVAAAAASVDGIVVPKVDEASVLMRLDGALTAIEHQAERPVGSTEIVPLIESSRGVLECRALLESSDRIRTVLFGSGEQGDLVADLGCEWTPEGTGLLAARSLVVLAARTVGVQPMDAVFMDFRNLDALREECRLARRTGYVGKVAIHPAQLPVIHEVFTPSAEEVAEQRRIVELFEQAVANGVASINVNGRMVDYAVAARARSVLHRAEAVRPR